jgi:hypothetical protein
VSDSVASGGRYIQAATAEQGTATYSFTVATEGQYKIIGRIYAADAGADSYYFSIDGAPEDTWDICPAQAASDFGVWRDDAIAKRGTGTYLAPQFDPYIVQLSAGTHTLVLRGREVGAKLDYFHLSGVGNCLHDADTDCDGCVRQDEMMQYIPQWKAGLVTLPQLMEAIRLWKQGC